MAKELGPPGNHLGCSAWQARSVPVKPWPSKGSWWDVYRNMSSIEYRYYGDTVDGCEILHHLGWLKPPINNVVNHLSTGAGFLPSTVCLLVPLGCISLDPKYLWE